MDWIVNKYIGIVSTRLRNFKRKGPNLYNCSCEFCGDSEKVKNRARGYIYEKQGKMFYFCHNCGITMTIYNFIKAIDLNLYNEMQLERLKDSKPKEQIEFEQFVDKMRKPVFLKSGPLKGLKKVSQLSPDDPVKKFVESRKIPNEYHAKLFSCPNFMNYVNGLIPNKFNEDALKHDELRLLIPFIDKDDNVFAFQGRTLRKSDVKYITIILDDSKPKIYGLDTVDFNRKTYVFEGPIDSTFVPNSIAIAGGEMVPALKGMNKDNLILIYDNEPRSKETVKKLDKAINNGYNVVIWPENLEHKDVNDMILAGLSPALIKNIIDEHIYHGLQAKLTLAKWSKV